MTTTKEFKTLHGLSDSAFNRLTNKIKAEYPDQALTRRINSRDWLIVDVALFEQYLSYQKREASAPKTTEAPTEAPAIDAEIVSDDAPVFAIVPSHIQTLDTDASAKLAALHERFAIKPFKPLDMNGDQASTVDLVAKLAATADAMAAENARIETDLAQRRQANALAEQVLKGVAQTIKAQVATNEMLQENSAEVASQDAQLKKRLAALQALLSD